MAITQARMVALIQAARDYQHGLEAAISTVEYEITQARAGRRSWDEAANNMLLALNPKLLLANLYSANTVISVEEHHFKLVHRDNERRAGKMARKRASESPTRQRRQHHTSPYTAELAQQFNQDRARQTAELGLTPPPSPHKLVQEQLVALGGEEDPENDPGYSPGADEPPAAEPVPEPPATTLSPEAQAQIDADIERLLAQDQAQQEFLAKHPELVRAGTMRDGKG